MAGVNLFSGLSSSINDTLGNDGDYYLTTDTNILVGPKNSGTWDNVNELSLVGGKFIVGSGVPPPSLGDIDDVYYDTSTGELYGPKNLSNDWGLNITQLKSKTIITGSGVPGVSTGGLVNDLYLDKNTKKLYEKISMTEWEEISNFGNFTSGNMPPRFDTGVEGDYYLDRLTLILYGPKTGLIWPVLSTMTPVSGSSNKSIIDKLNELIKDIYNYITDVLKNLGAFNVIFILFVLLLIVSIFLLFF